MDFDDEGSHRAILVRSVVPMTSLGRWLWTALDAFWIASIVTLLERGNLPKSRPRGCLGPLSGRRWTSANATPLLRI